MKSKYNRKKTNNSCDLTIFYGQKFYESVWDYEFILYHKFDASKLVVITRSWNTETGVAGFEYESE